MIEDAELLRRYAEERSEVAFAELVRRHLGLVYSVALRKVGGDAHLAQDVAQGVFTDLARKASALSRHAVLTGWFFTSTHYAAAKAVRSAQRRRTREQEAQLMHEQTSDPVSAIDWEQLRPVLDDLIGELDERDREAVLLRFFEGRDFPEMGAKLNLSPDGARSRVDRAVEKVRAALARRGVKSTAAALGLALAHQASVAAPVGLAATVTSAALSGAAGSGAGVLIFMSMNKLTLGIVGALVVAGGVTFYQQQQTNAQLRDEIVATQQSQAQQVAALRAENTRIARAAADANVARAAQTNVNAGAEREELLRLRSEVAALKTKADEAKAVMIRAKTGGNPPDMKPDASGKIPLAPGMVPVESWANVGHATPEAAFQTELWAAVGGDTDLVAKSFTFDAASRARAEALFGSLPDDARARFRTPELMLASFMASGTAFAGMQVLGTTATGPDDVTLTTQWQYTDGRVRQNDWQLHRGTDGNWQRVIPAGLVDKMSMSLRSSPQPTQTAPVGGK